MVTCALPVAADTLDGLIVTHGLPDGLGHVPGATVKDKGWPAVVETVMICEATLLVPPIWKPRLTEAGLTETGGVGVTVSVTNTVRGELPAGVMMMDPLYVPAGRKGTTALLRDTISEVGAIPEGGPT